MPPPRVVLFDMPFAAGGTNLTRQSLRERQLQGGPGLTGKVPGGPSRWSTERSGRWCPIRPELVAEVSYDQVTGGRFRHGTRLLRWRPDKTPRQCTDESWDARRGRAGSSLSCYTLCLRAIPPIETEERSAWPVARASRPASSPSTRPTASSPASAR